MSQKLDRLPSTQVDLTNSNLPAREYIEQTSSTPPLEEQLDQHSSFSHHLYDQIRNMNEATTSASPTSSGPTQLISSKGKSTLHTDLQTILTSIRESISINPQVIEFLKQKFQEPELLPSTEIMIIRSLVHHGEPATAKELVEQRQKDSLSRLSYLWDELIE